MELLLAGPAVSKAAIAEETPLTTGTGREAETGVSADDAGTVELLAVGAPRATETRTREKRRPALNIARAA